MAHITADRVSETASCEGTSDPYALAGALNSFQDFDTVMANNDTAFVFAEAGDDFEVLLATFTAGSPDELARTTIYASSNAGNAVNWAAGTVIRVTLGIPARFAELLNTIEATVADSATPDIGAAQGLRVVCDGTTTITSFGTGAHKFRIVRFSGARTLTYNATTLKLLGKANRTTVADDVGIYVSDGSGNWTEVSYRRVGVPPWGTAAISGQCRLVKNGANLELQRHNGALIFIAGQFEVIPASAPTLAPPATDGTLYYIYAYMNAGTLTLEESTTAPAADATYGHQIKTGDATRSLVGMARTVSSAWVDSATQRFVLSYFNRRDIGLVNAFTANRTTTSTSFVEINSEIRCEFLTWADEAVWIGYNGRGNVAASTNVIYAAIAIDDTTAEDAGSAQQMDSNFDKLMAAMLKKNGLAVGYHYATLIGKVNTGTGTWTGSATVGERNTITVGIRG